MVLGIVALLLGAAWVGQAIAQPADAPKAEPGATKGGPGRGDPAAMQARMEQFRQQMSDRMKQSFGATDEEWKVIQPRIEKVQTLSRQSRGGGGFGGGRGGPGGPPGGDRGGQPSDRQQSDVDKAGEALQKVLDNKDAPVEEIKAALGALRGARAAAKLELEAAQKALREVLSLRQEGQGVRMGLLE
jgi:hypothetical protein